MSDWKEDSLRHKYDPLPEQPARHRKKAKKVHVRSDHKHEYETVCIDAHSHMVTRGTRRPLYYTGSRCKVCGRLNDYHWHERLHEPPDDMPLYEVKDFLKLVSMRFLPDEMRVR